jgi:hypothetical protein
MNDTSNKPRFGNLRDWHTDEKLARDGARLDLGDGRALLVRRTGTGNRAFLAAAAELDSDDQTAQFETYARHVVSGWEGIVDAAGAPIPYTPEECVALFQYAPEIFDAVWVFATKRANYQVKESAEDADAVKS